MQIYGKEIAKKIIQCRIDEFTVKKKGVFPKDDRPSSATEFDTCTWRYACELSGQVGKKLREKPGLPIPFKKNELAAFFLHGWGWYVRDSFGSWDDGPDDAAFDEIDHLERDEVKDAVTGAFQAYRAAECVVGTFDNALALDAQKQEDAFWSADASLRTAELSESLRMALKKSNDAESAWRKKMVNQLLTLEELPDVDSRSAEKVPLAPAVVTTAQTAPTLASVVPASGGPAQQPAPAWGLITSLTRTPGYRWPLYQFLQAAHVAGKPCPKAQDVLDAWTLEPPPGLRVIQSGRRDELEYELTHGGKKTADLRAIQAAISGLVV
jgi:hypothetical protein